jgi:outer membrane protein assembly factor BamD
MADYELLVAEFYIKKGSFNAAIERLEGLLKRYPDYKKIEKAMLDLGISYKKIGRQEKAEEYLKILLEKYPNSPVTINAKKELSASGPVKK